MKKMEIKKKRKLKFWKPSKMIVWRKKKKKKKMKLNYLSKKQDQPLKTIIWGC